MHGSKCVFSLCLGLSYGYVVMSEFEWMHIFSGAYVVFFVTDMQLLWWISIFCH